MEVNITDLRVQGYIGELPEEKKHGQEFVVSVKCLLNDRCVANRDDIDDTVDYTGVIKLITDYFSQCRCDLIETACEDICSMILLEYEAVLEVDVIVRKPDAPIDASFLDVHVRNVRKWQRAYLSLGSNMGDKRQYIEDAIAYLKKDERIRTLRMSSLYDTKPYGKKDQEPFVNCVCEIETYMTPYELLDATMLIENRCGRKRVEKWGPRTLDIDIILYSDVIISTTKLTIPHIDMHNRKFVLEPLVEIAPFSYHPLLHKRAIDLYKEL